MNARSLMNFLSLRTQGRGLALPVVPAARDRDGGRAIEEEWARLMPITHAAFVKQRPRRPLTAGRR